MQLDKAVAKTSKVFGCLPNSKYPTPNPKLISPIFASKPTNMATTKITVNNNGSLRVEGDFEIVDKEGNKYDLGGRDVVSICRCGMSKNKPFCDGSHKGHFEHEAIAFALPPKKPV
jgi:CDGSH-type Zn-finger protein